jgi:hypothetical protein
MDGGTTMGTARCIGRVGALAVALGIGIALVTMPSVAWAEPADSGTRSGIDENPPVNGKGSVRPWIRKTRREAAGAHRAAPLKGQAKRRTAGWDLGMDAVTRAGIAEGLASQLRALTQFLVDREA